MVIHCIKCSRANDDDAAFCSGCAHRLSAEVPAIPIAYAPSRPFERRTQTVEATGKFWKALILLGSVGFVLFASIVIAMIYAGTARGPGTALLMVGSVAGFFVSFAVLLIGRAGAWWYHG